MKKISLCLKSFVFASSLALAFICSVFSSCEVGLGESVDTSAPSLKIDYPADGKVIMSAFTMHGTASDDTSISSVTIDVSSTSNQSGDVVLKSYTATYNSLKKEWTAAINLYNESSSCFDLADGEYKFLVTAKDSAGRTTEQSTVYKIDNTAPVVVLNRPGIGDTYGRTVKVTGNIADSNDASTLYFTAYRINDDGSLGEKINTQEYNVATGALERIVGKLSDDASESDLNEVYKAFYENSTVDGTANVYCTVEVSDSALEYQRYVSLLDEDAQSLVVSRLRTPASGTYATTVSGNLSTGYYLNSDIYKDVLSEKGYALKISDLTKIFNGTYEASLTDDDTRGEDGSAQTVTDKIKEILASYEISTASMESLDSSKISMFSVNPSNAPYYEVSGYKFEADSTGKKSFGGLTNESKITISVSQGRDQIDLVPDSVSVYVQKCDEDGTYTKNSAEYPKTQLIYSVDQINAMTDAAAKSSATAARKEAVTGSSESIKIVTEIGRLAVGASYLVIVEGKDLDDNEIETDDGNLYGFRVQSNGKPPVVTLNEEPADLSVCNAAEFTLSGSLTVYAESAKLYYSITASNEKGSGILYYPAGANEGAESAAELAANFAEVPLNDDLTWSLPITKELVSIPADVLYLYTVTLRAVDNDGNLSAEYARRVHVDTAKPVISNIQVSRDVTNATGDTIPTVNGNITISANVSDNYMLSDDGTQIIFYNKDDQSIELQKYTKVSDSFFSKSFNTSGMDVGDIIVKFILKDAAGNTDEVTKEIHVDQSTDKPQVTMQGDVKDAALVQPADIVSGHNLFSQSGEISASIKDANNDTIDSVLVEYHANTIPENDSEWKVLAQATGSSSTYNLSAPLLMEGTTTVLPEGVYFIRLMVTDKKSDNSAAASTVVGPFCIAIDDKAPIFSLSKDSASGSYMPKNQDITVTGTVMDSSGSVTVSRYDNIEGTGTVYSTATLTPSDAASIKAEAGVTWTDTITGVGDSGNTFYYIASDKYGRKTTLQFMYKIDSVAPSVYPGWTASMDNNPTADWTNTTAFTFKIPVSDAWDTQANKVLTDAAGVDKVTIYVYEGAADANGDPTSSGAMSMGGKYKDSTNGADNYYYTYNSTQSITTNGTSFVTIKAKDLAGAGNESGVLASYTLKIDTVAPTVSLVNIPDNSLSLVGNDISAAGYAVSATVTDNNGGSGIDSVTIKENGTVIATGVFDDDSGNYSFTLPKARLTTGTHTFVVHAKDIAGNVNSDTSISVTVDADAPKFSGVSYSPTAASVSDENVADSEVSVVNGIVNITGTITDETMLPDSGSTVIYWKATVTSGTQTQGAGSAVSKSGTVNMTTTGLSSYAFSFKLDTKELKDGTCVVQMNAVDKATNRSADNASNSSVSFTIQQRSDYPIANLESSIGQTSLSDENVTASAIVDAKNVLSKDGKITGTLTDDDGIGAILMEYSTAKNGSYTSLYSVRGGNKTTYSLGAPLDALTSAGIYWIRLTITDDTAGNGKRLDGSDAVKTVIGPFAIGIDNEIPTLSISTEQGQFKAANTAFTVRGLTYDDSGEVTIDRYYLDDNGVTKRAEKTLPFTSLTSETSWEDTITAAEVGDTAHVFTYVATDKFGNTTKQTFKFVIDNYAPTNYDNATQQLGSSSWQGTSTYTFDGVYVSDAWNHTSSAEYPSTSVSGIEAVYLTIDSGTPIAMSPGSLKGDSAKDKNFTLYTSTQPLKDGSHTAVITAKDKAGKTSGSLATYTVKIDTTAPTVSAVTTTGGKTSLTAVDINAFDIIVTAADGPSDSAFGTETSGISSVNIYKNGSSIANTTTLSGGTYAVRIPSTELTTGNHTFTVYVTDAAGNTNNSKSVGITVDVTPPTVENVSYSPTVASALNDNTEYVNGVITVNGKVTDETKLGTTGALSWTFEQTEAAATNTNAGVTATTASGTVDLSGNASESFSFKIATDLVADGTYTLTVTATDAANNTATTAQGAYVKTGILVNQSTNIPSITLNGVNVAATSEQLKTGANLYGMGNNTLNVTVTDDDGIAAITYKVDSNEVVSVPIDNSPLSKTFAIDMTQFGSGDHTLHITATDISKDISGNSAAVSTSSLKDTDGGTSATMLFAYDDDAPSISISTVSKGGEDVAYTNGMWLGTNFTVKGSTGDASGIATLEYSNDGSNWTSFNDSIALTAGTAEWSHSLENQSDTQDGKLYYRATDVYGRVSQTAQIAYNIDTVSPVLVSDYIKVKGSLTQDGSTTSQEIALSALSDTWFTAEAVQLIGVGNSSENARALKETNPEEITLTFDENNIYHITAGSLNAFKSTFTLPEGTNRGTLVAVDKAGNKSASIVLTIKVDATAPVISNVLPKDEKTSLTAADISKYYIDVAATDKDGGSAIATVVLKEDTTEIAAATELTGSEYRLSIASEKLTTASHSFVVYVTDKAGNVTASNPQVITVDQTAPAFSNDISYTPQVTVDGNKYVNGTITVSGTITDETRLGTTDALSWKIEKTADAAMNTNAGVSATTATGTVSLSGGKSELFSFTIDTKTVVDGTYTLTLTAKDAAQNTQTKEFANIVIDQDTDRPVITFTNLTLTSGMTNSAPIWNKADEIYGTVTDDDGVSEVYVSFDGTTWSTTSIFDAGSWSFTFSKGFDGSAKGDGERTIYFKVIDANNTEFVSTTTKSALIHSVKLIDKASTPNKYGYKDAGGKYDSTPFPLLYIKTDTQNPTIPNIYYFAGETSYDDSKFTSDYLKGIEANIADQTDTDKWTSGTPASVGGTKRRYLYALVHAEDANGVKGISAKWDGTLADAEVSHANIDEKTLSVFRFDMNAKATGYSNIVFTATDNVDRIVQKDSQIQIDNDAPVISYTSHKDGTQVFGSSSVSVKGISNDIENLYVTVTDSATAPTEIYPNTFTTSASKTNSWKLASEKTSAASFTINFAESGNNDTSGEFYAGPLNNYYDLYFSPTSSDDNAETKDMYVWLYGEDSLGNRGAGKSLNLKVNPRGDKPTVEILYPADDNKVGGSIRISGTSAVQNTDVTVSSIYVQIDPAYNGSFDETWYTALTTKKSTIEDSEYLKIVDQATIGKGILASGDVKNWNLTINTYKELENDKEISTIGLRVYAVSSGGKVSEASQVSFQIDPNVPVIGDPEKGSLKLEKHENDAADGAVLKTIPYTSGMYISGIWYLKGSVYDDSGIKTITLHDSFDGTTKSLIGNTSYSSYLAEDGVNVVTSGEGKNYQMNIPIGKSSGFGTVTYTLTAIENTQVNLSSQTKIEINYDNVNPAFTLTDATWENALAADTSLVVQNSNGTYSISGKVNENAGTNNNTQSGFNRIAMFFTRTLNNTTYVIDPMIAGGTNGTANRYASTEFEYNAVDGIYWRKYETATVDASNGTVTLASELKNIRKGGLCKIDDVLFLISDVDSTNNKITLDSSPASGDTKTAYFALAQIIDHVTTEDFGDVHTQAYNENTTLPMGYGDDGDQMCETVIKSGTTWNWTAEINSSLILDGSVDVHFVAYDKAGNLTKANYSGTVKNNQPRIAGIIYGHDDNLSGSIEDSELRKGYTGLYTKAVSGFTNGYSTATKKVDVINLSGDGTSISEDFTASSALLNLKGRFLLRPEIVGGNIGIDYQYSVTKSDASEAYVTSDSTVLSTQHASGDNVRSGDTALSDIDLTLADLLAGGIKDGDLQKFAFVLYDKTEGLSGDARQKATINIWANVALQDNTAPTASIAPFYWESASKNSLYENKSANGHIELENDLPPTKFTQNGSTIYDRDPKVSGKITLRGIAKDNSHLSSISVTVPNFKSNGNTTLALATYDYDNSKWTLGSEDMDTNGWSAKIEEETFSNTDGHTVKWALNLNTALITTVAAADVKVTVSATDHGIASVVDGTVSYSPRTAGAGVESSTSATSTTQTTTSANTPYYKMDVVPYMTKISTPNRTKSGLKDNNIRSASGKYSIIKGSTADFIKIEGFNLSPATGAVRIKNEANAKSTSSTATDGIGVAFSNIASDFTSFYCSNNISKSGYLELFTNGVRSLNNINNDDAHDTNGSGSAIGSAIADWANYYNREPDYYTTKNVQLTDDRYLRFFDMHTAQTPDPSKTTGVTTNLKNAYYPVMIMNGDNPVFGYMNGSGGPNLAPGSNAGTGAGEFYPSHAMPQRAEFNGSTGEEVYTEYLIKASAWDGMGMAVDEGGRYYNVSSYNRDGSAMSLIYDRYAELYTDTLSYRSNNRTYYYYNSGSGWGAGTGYSVYWDKGSGYWSYDADNNAITLDSMNYGDGILLGRYMYPKLIANGNSKTGTAKVYMAYYDDGTGEIAFRNFQLGTTVSGTATALDSSHKDKNNTTYSQKINFSENTSNYGSDAAEGRLTAVSSGSKYYDMVVTSDNHVVIVYYDEDDSKLKLIYSTNAVDGSSPTAAVAWTTSSVDFPSYAGTYVSMAIDSSNGIHIAAFDASDADLKYFYLQSYSSTSLTSMTVDAAGSVGHWTGIAICTDTDNAELYGKPVISYYNSTETGTRESIKMAYPKAAIGSITAGVDSNRNPVVGYLGNQPGVRQEAQ